MTVLREQKTNIVQQLYDINNNNKLAKSVERHEKKKKITKLYNAWDSRTFNVIEHDKYDMAIIMDDGD